MAQETVPNNTDEIEITTAAYKLMVAVHSDAPLDFEGACVALMQVYSIDQQTAYSYLELAAEYYLEFHGATDE